MSPRSRIAVAALAVTLPLHGPLSAQISPDVVARDWERYRANVVQMVEAMPEAHLGFRPTPEVRTFAEQIEHIVTGNLAIVGQSVVGMEAPPPMGNPQAYLARKAELIDWVNRTYDHLLGEIRALSPAQLEESGTFGPAQLPKWQILDLAREHGIWTLGQTVPYLRLNGAEVPAYQMLSGG